MNLLTLLDRMRHQALATAPRSGIAGNPWQDHQCIDGPQAFSDSCVIKAQEIILEQFFVRDFDESALREVAMENGWYHAGGTLLQDIGKLLECAGIPITQRHQASGIDLFRALAEGKKVIVGLDGGELRQHGSLHELLEEWLVGPQADHAVLVSGLDFRDPHAPGIFITDPATGGTHLYPLERFMDAWSDSSCFMMETAIPAPPWVEGMGGFDYALGHLAQVGHLPYAEFTRSFAPSMSPVDYDSAFSLQELLSFIPRSYAGALEQASAYQHFAMPSDWQSLCLSDELWVGEIFNSLEPIQPAFEALIEGVGDWVRSALLG